MVIFKEKESFTNYMPSPKALEILQLLSKDSSLTYGGIKRITGLSDTGLSKILNRLDRYGAIRRSEKRFKPPIHITKVGLYILARRDGLRITQETLDAQGVKDFHRIFREVQRVHAKLFRMDFETGISFDEKSRTVDVSYQAGIKSLMNDMIIFVAAVKIKEKEIILYRFAEPKGIEQGGLTVNDVYLQRALESHI